MHKKRKQKKRKEGLRNKQCDMYRYTHTYVLTGYVKLKSDVIKSSYYHTLNSKEVREQYIYFFFRFSLI